MADVHEGSLTITLAINAGHVHSLLPEKVMVSYLLEHLLSFWKPFSRNCRISWGLRVYCSLETLRSGTDELQDMVLWTNNRRETAHTCALCSL